MICYPPSDFIQFNEIIILWGPVVGGWELVAEGRI